MGKRETHQGRETHRRRKRRLVRDTNQTPHHMFNTQRKWISAQGDALCAWTHRRLRARLALSAALVVLALVPGCATHGHVAAVDQEVSGIRGNQELILSKLDTLEQNQIRVAKLSDQLETLQQQLAGMPSTDTNGARTAMGLQRTLIDLETQLVVTNAHLAETQERFDQLETRLRSVEAEQERTAAARDKASRFLAERLSALSGTPPETAPEAGIVTARVVPPAPEATGAHTVEHMAGPGETLGTIAAAHFGDPAFWLPLWEANPQLHNPHHLEVGDTVVIPPQSRISLPGPKMAAKPAAAPPMPEPAPSTFTHTVAPGDTLGTIAAAYLGDSGRWREVLRANPDLADPDRVKVGQLLQVPVRDGATVARDIPEGTPTPSAPDPATGMVRHTVTPGDTLGTIANVYLGSPREWRRVWGANPELDDPDRLVAGQVLNVPVGKLDVPVAEPADTTAPGQDTPGKARHVIAPGDTLGTIAATYLGDSALWRTVWEANPWLDSPDRIEVGQTLEIPLVPGVGSTASRVQPLWHTVQAGETLGIIAARYLGDPAMWEVFWAANPSLPDPHDLTPGQVLRVPGQ